MGFRVYNVCSRREDKNGKVHWPRVGVIFFDESEDKATLKIDLFPDDAWFVFPQERKEDQSEKGPF